MRLYWAAASSWCRVAVSLSQLRSLSCDSTQQAATHLSDRLIYIFTVDRRLQTLDKKGGKYDLIPVTGFIHTNKDTNT